MKKKMSKCLLVAFIIGIAYMAYSVSYWSGVADSAGVDTAEQLGTGIALLLVMPHLAFTALAVLFNALGLFLKTRGFALTAGILYSIALVVFPAYFMFVILEAILCYVGFAKMPKKGAA